MCHRPRLTTEEATPEETPASVRTVRWVRHRAGTRGRCPVPACLRRLRLPVPGRLRRDLLGLPARDTGPAGTAGSSGERQSRRALATRSPALRHSASNCGAVAAAGSDSDQFGYFFQQGGQVLSVNRDVMIGASSASPKDLASAYKGGCGAVLLDPGVR